MRHRKLASLMAGALTAAALVVPAIAGSATAAPAAAPSALTATADLNCVFGDFAIAYVADLTESVNGTAVTGSMANDFVPGMPAFIAISNLDVALQTTIDGAAVTLHGADAYSPAKPGNSSFPMPALSGTRASGAAPSTLAITGAVLTMTSSGTPYTITCTAPQTGPTAECTTAQAQQTQAEAAVAQATSAVTKATKTAKSAKAAVAKLQKQKQTPPVKKKLKAAKAKLKKANAALAASKKKLAAAQSSLTTAKNAVAAEC